MSEATEHEALFDFLARMEGRYPDVRWAFHTPNGEKRDKATAAKLKRMGVRAGVLDAHQGPVVLSGYCCALYDDRLAHWRVSEHEATDAKGQAKIEALWINPACVERLGYGPLFGEER